MEMESLPILCLLVNNSSKQFTKHNKINDDLLKNTENSLFYCKGKYN